MDQIMLNMLIKLFKVIMVLIWITLLFVLFLSWLICLMISTFQFQPFGFRKVRTFLEHIDPLLPLQQSCLFRAVFQIRPVLPSEMDKKACERANNGTSPSCRSGLFPATSEFLNFSNRTIIKGDKQCQNYVFPLFQTIKFLYMFFSRAGHFLRGQTTLRGNPSCGRVLILTSL